MSCEHDLDAIGELVEGRLSPSSRAALDRHLLECPTCRGLADDLRRIRQAAQALPRLKPPVDGWTRIEARLRAEARTAPGARTRFAWLTTRPAWWSPIPLLAAATLVLAVGAAVLLVRPDSRPSGSAAVTAPSAGAAAEGNLVESVESELRLAEQHYEKAIAGLEQIAKAGEGSLDPQVALALQRNLSVIDQAIEDSRLALQTQPTSQIAQESLFEAFRRKVGLLQDTIALINEVRKGNQAGASRILG